MHVAFIGLGAMGYPMAGHLANAGFNTNIYNRTKQTAEKWLNQYAGSAFDSPKEAAQGASVVCLCVGNDNDVRSVVYGESGVLEGMQAGSYLVDHTTTSAELARELASECAIRDIHFLDAPVSGGQAGAENGKLTVMLGGDESDYAAVIPVLEAYSQKHALIGKVGSGQLCKMVNQICIAGVVQGLSEALHFAQQADLDVTSVIDVISKGAAQSWQMENRWQTMINNEFDFGFAVDWMRKDLDIVLQEAKNNQSTLPLTAMVDQFYAKVQANGGNRYDTSSLITLLTNK